MGVYMKCHSLACGHHGHLDRSGAYLFTHMGRPWNLAVRRRRAISDTAVLHESVRERIGDPELKYSPKVPAGVTYTA